MTASDLLVALVMDWDGRCLSRDATLAEAEQLEEAIGEAVEEHLAAMERATILGDALTIVDRQTKR